MTRNEHGESYEAFPGLSRTLPPAFFNDGWWKPWDMRGASLAIMSSGDTLLVRFETQLSVISGPWAHEGHHQARALSISDASSAIASL